MAYARKNNSNRETFVKSNGSYFCPDLLTVNQAVQALHLCRQSIYKYIADGTIPAFKNPAGKYLIPKQYVEDCIAGCYNKPATNNCDCPATKEGTDYVG